MVYVQGYQKVLQTFPSSSLEQDIHAKEDKQGLSTFCTPSQFPRRKLSKSIKVLQICEKEVGWWPCGGKYRCFIALLQWPLFNSILKLNVGKDSKVLQICEKEVGWWPSMRWESIVAFIAFQMSPNLHFLPLTFSTTIFQLNFDPIWIFTFSLPVFIGPESNHWQCLSVTHWLTDSLRNV